MKTFKTLNELLEELYVELDADYPREHYIDELINELYVFLAENHNDDTVSECDGNCDNCKYAHEDDLDEYEHGYNDVPQDLEEFMDGKYDDVDNNTSNKYDSVNHPNYYVGKIEVIDFIEDKKLNYNLGNCVKYIARAGKKHEAGMSDLEKTIEDLSKARWYLDREINTLKKHRDF